MSYAFDLLPAKGPLRSDSRRTLFATALIVVLLLTVIAVLTRTTISPVYFALVVFAVVAGQYAWSYISTRRQTVQVAAFAKANGLESGSSETVKTPPVLDRTGAHGQRISNHYRFALKDGACSVYDYHFDIGSGRSQRRFYYSVAHLELSKRFPHIFLDGHGNRLSSRYGHGQKLALEGDFNRFFSLYLPDNEQVDVLSVLSPDVMQALVDSGRPYDIEISGRDVYVCSGRPFYTRNALPHLLAFMQKLTDELAHRSASWQDTLPGKPASQLQVAFWKSLTGRVLLILLPVIIGAVIVASVIY